MGSLAFAKDLQSLINKANNKIKSNDLESAEILLQNVLDTDPSFAPAHIAYSKIWLRKGDLSKANEYATLAVRIDEDFRPWWEKLNEIRAGVQNGQKYARESNFTKAFDEYEAVSEKYPYFSQVHYFMGIIKYKQKDFKEAALFFENALKIYPDYHKAKQALNNVKKRFPN
tara:strand:- start:349 stop:861 length:513 start_codon:yes stop_codon:yes gene_type:complete